MTKPELKPEFKEIGLGKQNIAQVFLAKVRGLQKQWEHLTPDQRLAEIKTIVNDVYSSAGFPKVEVVKEKLSADGRFDRASHTLQIDEKFLEGDKINNDRINNLAKTVYHEMRHGDQSYRGVQALAKHSKVNSEEAEKIKHLAESKGIQNIEFFTQAIRDGEKTELSETEAEFAEVMREVFFGNYEKYATKVKNEAFDLSQASQKAQNLAYHAGQSPKYSSSEAQAIESNAERLMLQYLEKEEEYKNILQEKDARDIEEVVQNCINISSVPAQTAQAAESSRIQTGESSTQPVRDDEITPTPRTPRRVSLTVPQTQAGGASGTRPEETEMEDLDAPRPVGAPPPRPRPRRSTNPISDCLPCFGKSRRSDSRSGRSRTHDDRRTR